MNDIGDHPVLYCMHVLWILADYFWRKLVQLYHTCKLDKVHNGIQSNITSRKEVCSNVAKAKRLGNK